MKLSLFISRSLSIVKIFLLGLKQRLKPANFLLLMCIIVSITTSFAVVLLKNMVFHLEKYFFDNGTFFHFLGFKSVLPIIGIGVSTILISRIYKKNFLKGNDKIIYVIAKKAANLPFSLSFSPLVTSAVTVGLGGSAGLESPIVAAGSAIGSNWGRSVYLTQKEKTLLIGCGAASGIATAFSAPIAGVLFALEVLMIDLSLNALVPLLLSVAASVIIGRAMMGGDILLYIHNIQPFKYQNFPYYIALGIICGLVAKYYTKMYEWMEELFEKIDSIWKKWLIGGIGIGVMIFFFPPVLGEGYSFVRALADSGNIVDPAFWVMNAHNPWLLLLFLFAVVLLKVFAVGFTVLGGGNGGSFAPAMFIGGVVGFIMGRFAQLAWGADVPMTNFVVAGMAGILCGVFYAPLMSIFLSAEVTNGYPLMIPLMIVVGTSYLVVKAFNPLSMDMQKLKDKTALDTLDKDHFLLSRLDINAFIQSDRPYFYESTSMSEILDTVANNNHEIFSVINLDKQYVGVISLKELKNLLLSKDDNLNKVNAVDIMVKVEPLYNHDSISKALDIFEADTHNMNEHPVVDKDNVFLGFVKEARILEMYRAEIKSGYA